MPLLRAFHQKIHIFLFLGLLVGFFGHIAQGQSSATSQSHVTSAVLGQEHIQEDALAIARPQSFPARRGVHGALPELDAAAVYVFDSLSAFPLVAKESTTAVPVASLTKLATALVAVHEIPLDKIVVVPSDIEKIYGSTIHLEPDELVSLADILAGLLISSGNDAAYTIADNYPGGLPSFVQKMNETARHVGAKNTHFDNPVGYDTEQNYATAEDIGLLAQKVLNQPTLASIVKTHRTVISGNNGAISHYLVTTNPLLVEDSAVVGVKTGTSETAGENLVLARQWGDRVVIFVILGSTNRVEDAKKLISWIEAAYVL